jgi:hypothetical protein
MDPVYGVPGLPVVLDASYDDCLVWGLVPAKRVINILVSRRRGRAYKEG